MLKLSIITFFFFPVGVEKEDVLWTEKYQPQDSSELVGNRKEIERLHRSEPYLKYLKILYYFFMLKKLLIISHCAWVRLKTYMFVCFDFKKVAETNQQLVWIVFWSWFLLEK